MSDRNALADEGLSDAEKADVEEFLRMQGFHWRNNIFWRRKADGAVCVSHHLTGEVESPWVVWEIPEAEWASIVASVSEGGETLESWQAVRDFHATSYAALRATPTAEDAKLVTRILALRSDPKPDYERDIWSCKIGEAPRKWEAGGDGPMREAVAEAYFRLTGKEPTFIFSGWGRSLTEGERAVVENREPDYSKTDFGILTEAADRIEALASEARSPQQAEVSDGYHTFSELYRERAVLATIIAKLSNLASSHQRAGTGYDAQPGFDGWRTVLYIDTPNGQVSWHFSDADAAEFLTNLPDYPKEYDGHDTPTKYARNEKWAHDLPQQTEVAHAVVRALVDAGLLTRVDYWGQAHDVVRAALTRTAAEAKDAMVDTAMTW